MPSIFERLQYNFDSTKFGDAIDPTGTLENDLAKIKPSLYKWQFDALANNDVSGYVQNPLATDILTIQTNAQNIRDLVITFDDPNASVANLQSVANTLYYETISFKAHTDRISGVTLTTDATLPDFGSAVGLGEFLLSIVSVYDGVMNNTPVLGSMTSLFVGPEISSNATNIATDYGTLNGSIQIAGNSALSSATVNAIASRINTTYNLMNQRRTHDVTYYNNGMSIMNDYSILSRFTSFTALKLYLTENYVGTDKLKIHL
jgi:hypothetical protein